MYTYSKRSPVGSQSSGDWVLELLDDAGAVLRSVRFATSTSIDDLDPSEPYEPGGLSEHWRVLVEDPPAYSSYRIKQRSQVVLESAVSPCAPEVTVISPIAGQTVDGSTVTVTWSGYDADGDDLTYHVHYSSDGGETYSAVGVGLSETSEETSLEYLEGFLAGALQGDRHRRHPLNDGGVRALHAGLRTQGSVGDNMVRLRALARIAECR